MITVESSCDEDRWTTLDVGDTVLFKRNGKTYVCTVCVCSNMKCESCVLDFDKGCTRYNYCVWDGNRLSPAALISTEEYIG